MTLKKDMATALEEEDFHDVNLVGTDHVEVPATKAVLAIRSTVFKRMFFGSFQERDKDRVSLNYPSLVLKVLVKYCYTDELDLDMLYQDDNDSDKEETASNKSSDNGNAEAAKKQEKDSSSYNQSDEEAVLMVQLRDAANYLHLKQLHKAVSNELGESISHHLQEDIRSICAILSELFSRGETEGPMWDMMMKLMLTDPQQCLLANTKANKGILACALPLVHIILSDHSLDPFVAASCLQTWCEAHPHVMNTSKNDDDDNSADDSPKEKDDDGVLVEPSADAAATDRDVLLKTARAINIEGIPINQLAKIEPCQLFPMERLFKAFQKHGKKADAPTTTFGTSPLSPSSNSGNRLFYAHVFGAGVECLNGTYLRENSTCYSKTGQYGDLKSVFNITFAGDKWKIIVRPSLLSEDVATASEMEIYESAPCDSIDTTPFASWTCLDGKDPSPYVAIANKHLPLSSFSSGIPFAFSAAAQGSFDPPEVVRSTSSGTSSGSVPRFIPYADVASHFPAGRASRPRARRRRQPPG